MYSITKMCNSKKDVEAVYLFLSDLCSEYSNFRQWYHDTVVPGLANGERLIYAVTDNEAIVAVLILKNADEKKICTLRVAENHRHQGIASMLLTLAFRELQCTKPLITVSSYHIDEFKPLLEKSGFVLYAKYPNFYKWGITEYAFNGCLSESVDLESRNEKFDTEALWCSLEAPNTLNPFVTGYLYSGNSETESDEWLVRIGDGYRAADDDSPRLIFVNEEAVSIQDSRGEFEGENKYKWFAATEKQFDKPFSYVNFGTRLEEATHGCVKRIQSMIVSKDEATVNRIADMLDSMGFDAVTGYFDPQGRRTQRRGGFSDGILLRLYLKQLGRLVCTTKLSQRKSLIPILEMTRIPFWRVFSQTISETLLFGALCAFLWLRESIMSKSSTRRAPSLSLWLWA
jgi:hypothetical protein